MIRLTLAEVAAATSGHVEAADREVAVDTVTTDSRQVEAGALFVALRGERHDGHDHVAEALAAGAAGYLAERRVADGPGVVCADTWRGIADLARAVRERVDPQVVAITGSVGKTTTKDLTAAALRAGLRTVAARGSYNNEVGVPLTCLGVTAETEALVVEVGARGVGHIRSLMPVVQPDVAIVTAVSGAHLEMFRDLDTVARAKSELVEGLAPDGTAVLNADDPRVAAMAEATRGRVLFYGRGPGAVDLTADDVTLDRLARPAFRARTPWGDARVRLPVAGEHHVHNALAALAAAGVLGVDLGSAADALAEAAVASWRSEVVERYGIVMLNDAYNANRTSTIAALDTLAWIGDATGGRTWAVLGYMAELGESSREDHEAVGRVCAETRVDQLVVVDHRDARLIAEGAVAAGLEPDRVTVVPDAVAALEHVRLEVGPGDVVLVKASRVAGLERVAAELVGDAEDAG